MQAYTSSGAEHVRCIPRTNSIFLDQPPAVAGIEKKLLEFSAAFASDAAGAQHALSADEVVTLKALLETLGLREAAHTPAHYVLVEKLIRWPAACLFPVLDVVRALILHSNAAKHFSRGGWAIHAFVLGAATGECIMANRLMALRFFVNCFKSADATELVLRQRAQILDELADSVEKVSFACGR
jgi:hypothetical protein